MACGFSGSSQFLTVAPNVALQPGLGDFAISVLVNPSFNPAAPASAYNTILSLGRYDNGILLRSQAQGTSGNDNFYINNTLYNWAPYTWLSKDTWTSIIISRSSSVVKLYVNGTERLSVTNSTSISPTTNTRIGCSEHTGGEFWFGSIAELALWKGAGLTDAEITSLSRGFTANQIRPQSLSFYAPLMRDFQDLRNGLVITNNNGATVATHPRIIT